jgi:general secretion pathway protein E
MTPVAAIQQFTYAFAKDKGVVVLPGRDVLTLGMRAGGGPSDAA